MLKSPIRAGLSAIAFVMATLISSPSQATTVSSPLASLVAPQFVPSSQAIVLAGVRQLGVAGRSGSGAIRGSRRGPRFIYGYRGGKFRGGRLGSGRAGNGAIIAGNRPGYSKRAFSADKFRSGNLKSKRRRGFAGTGYSYGDQRRWFPNNFYSNRHFSSSSFGWGF